MHRGTTTSPIGVALVAIAALALSGCGATGSSDAPSAPSAAAATVAPAATVGDPVLIPDDDLVLSPGRYRWYPFDEEPTLSVVAEVPNGWRSVGPLGMTIVGGTDAPGGMGIGFQRVDAIFSDPCHWDVDGSGNIDQPGDVAVGPSVADLVAALRANTSYTATVATPVAFGEHHGSSLTIQVPAAVDLQSCDKQTGNPDNYYFFFEGGLYAQGAGNRWNLSIVDVGGTRVVVTVLDYEGTPAAIRDAAKAIVASMRFTP